MNMMNNIDFSIFDPSFIFGKSRKINLGIKMKFVVLALLFVAAGAVNGKLS